MKNICLENILKIVCNYYRVNRFDISSKSRSRKFIPARQMYCYLSKKITSESLGKIGFIINRDHATVLHSFKSVEVEKTIYPDVYKSYCELMEILSIPDIVVSDDIDLLQMTINYTNSYI